MRIYQPEPEAPEREGGYSRQELAILIVGLDVPDCGCHPKKTSVCVIARRPCAERRQEQQHAKQLLDDGQITHEGYALIADGKCKCPKSAPPCEHIRSALCELTDVELSQLLWAAYPDAYSAEFPDAYRPPKPSRPRLVTHGSEPTPIVINGQRRVAEPYTRVMEERETMGEQITNPFDEFIESSPDAGRLIHHNQNGSPILGDLLRLHHCDQEPDQNILPLETHANLSRTRSSPARRHGNDHAKTA